MASVASLASLYAFSIRQTPGSYHYPVVHDLDMGWTGIFVTRLLFLVSPCLAGITTVETEQVESTLVEATVNILRSCYGNRPTPVGLAGNAAGTIAKALWSQDHSPATLIDDNSAIVTNNNDGPYHTNNRQKLQIFVVTASSPGTLMRNLRQIKASIWWNHMATFLIIDWFPSNFDCSDAHEMLWTAWTIDILDAKFICYHRTENRLIYTFNPYTSWAPGPWQLDKIYSGKNNHPWTLFVRGYDKVEQACDKLDFVKTNDLGGYEIRISVPEGFIVENAEADKICSGRHNNDLCSILMATVNATTKMMPYGYHDSQMSIDNEKNLSPIPSDIVEGLSDVLFNGHNIATVGNATTSYPYHRIEIYAMTQYSGYRSQLGKIISIVDSGSRYALCLVLIITILYYRYMMRTSVAIAILNTIRIVCNSTLPRLPAKFGPRIYLGCLFLFVLTMQGIFQGRLSSLLTNNQPIRNVNTLKDLAELGHMIYGNSESRMYFNDSAFKGRWEDARDPNECTERVQHDSKAACVGPKHLLAKKAAEFGLYVSREPLAFYYLVLPIRPDWPIERRLNELLFRAANSHLKRYLNKRGAYRANQRLIIQEYKYKDEGIKVLIFRQLRFAFVILAIGLGFAAVIFTIEVIIG